MKKTIAILIITGILSGCGSSKTIDGITYDTYGFINKDNVRDPSVQYRVITGNVVWAIILSESIAFPIYFLGFSLFEPTCKKPK